MKNIIYIVFSIICFSCNDSTTEQLDFFKSMNHYSSFDDQNSQKIDLHGFDKIILKPTNQKINNHKCYALLTNEYGYFNIRGNIWLEDSIIYINTDIEKLKKQILFNFKTKSTWELTYSLQNDPYPYRLNITNEGKYYSKDINDSINAFRIVKSYCSWDEEYYIFASLNYGFVSVSYWNNTNIYDINLISRKISIRQFNKNLPRKE